jgi:hypothetical protein
MTVWIGALLGAGAGAAGTTALHLVTYLDMAVRGRPASRTPEQTIETVARKIHIEIPGREDQKQNRLTGLGALAGIATGVSVGALFGILRAAGWRPGGLLTGLAVGLSAMTAGNAGMATLKVTDPRTWTRQEWAADLLPHLAYAAVTGGLLQAYDQR